MRQTSSNAVTVIADAYTGLGSWESGYQQGLAEGKKSGVAEGRRLERRAIKSARDKMSGIQFDDWLIQRTKPTKRKGR